MKLPDMRKEVEKKSNVKICKCGEKYIPTPKSPKMCMWCMFKKR